VSSMPTPKDRFTALDTLAVVRELRRLGPARVDKAFDLPGGGWAVTVRAPGKGRQELVLVPGKYAAVLAEGPEHSEELSPLAKELRRLLTGATLRQVIEPTGERVVQAIFGRSAEPAELLLVFEIFGVGNLLLVGDARILAVATPRRWAHRTVRVGAEYAPAPGRPDPWSLSIPDIEGELARSRTDLASTLAVRLSLGGALAEELIARGGWNPGEATAPRSSELAPRLHAELARLFADVSDEPAGFVYIREGVAVDATPYPSRRWQTVPGTEEVRRPSFSLAAQEYFSAQVVPPESPEEVAATRARRSLEHLAEQQRAAVAELSGTVSQLKAQADAILTHYAQAEAALEQPSPETPPPTLEAVLGETRVVLTRGRSPRMSAQALFDEAKRAQTKLAGAQTALADTERRLSEPVASARPSARSPRATATRARSAHWFEKFRWFVSSEGVVVVAGRDASSNDLIVKRHLKEGDLYVHADIHGAASVIVKHPAAGEPPMSEATLLEAGQWAVAFSKAWRAGLASAAAFWVPPDQVSKSSESGEFVARGAWIIRGTKHVMRDLPLELALGTISYDGEDRWTAAPPASVRRRGAVRFLLTPGDDRERADREVELSQELGISRSLLQSLLPAGGLTVRRP
jgi:predicted ribosome quality control (RQC) complex YloA/Tae2 family protein